MADEGLMPKVRSVRLQAKKKVPSSSPHVKPPKGRWRLRFIGKWLLLVFCSSLILMLGLVGGIWLTGEFLPLERIDEGGVMLYDHRNQPLIQLAKERDPVQGREIYHEFISLSDLMEKNNRLVEAMIKVEDARFYKHDGVDFYALFRSLILTLTGQGEQGGSTITMQVARKVVLGTQERTLSRKLKEMAAALNLERDKGKEEILEAYLNRIEFGNNIYGVQTAAKVYFGKDLRKDQLNAGEIAVIAGLPQGTTIYNPYRGEYNRKRLKKRQTTVLAVMARQDEMPPIISQREKEYWSKRDLPIKDSSNLAEYKRKIASLPFLELIKEEITRKYPHLQGEDLFNHDLKIYTTINPKIQQKVNELLEKDELFVDQQGRKMPKEKVDAGITVLDPQDGGIVAVGSGRQYQPGYMHRALEKHPPGSILTPLMIYGPAMEEKGFRASSFVKDEPFFVKERQIDNVNQTYQGIVTFRQMVEKSLDAPTAQLLNQIGLHTAIAYGKHLGLPIEAKDHNYFALGLGEMDKGVSSKEVAQAYTVLANQGTYRPAFIIREIKLPYPDGREERIQLHNPQKQVFQPRIAAQINALFKQSLPPEARLPNVIGRSAITRDQNQAWIVGYTPDLLATVIVHQYGQKEGEEPYQLSVDGVPAQLFREIMLQNEWTEASVH
jgi:penicillin-binding protein 2A